ncbi:MAG: sigma-54-dependent Fis family transcriptional regulator [Candidatus Omnitrophica bacterium]|nr:sigma-54-dependent Fis family transcriptional regulator [Candidatus Omnitrophota bacterium]
MKQSILIVDDEPLTRKSLFEILRHRGYKVNCVGSAQEALDSLAKDPPDIVITDLKMPGLDGMELLKQLKAIDNDIAVVLMTAFGSIENAVEAMKEGAYDYITKPIVDNEIELVIERIFEQKRLIEENKTLKKRLADTSRAKFHGIIGQAPQMQKIYNLIDAVASTNATVLIQGDSGTGKRMVACAIHRADKFRHDKPFIEVSCGALPENLLESELFGHVKGSFTSAIRDRQGRFELAAGGIIFLDEIDTFSPNLQVKLLRVLQEGEFERVGDTKTFKVDVKVVAATNQNLKKLIAEGKFREDLYYRLNVIPVYVPALRERKGDIPLLVEHFLEKCSKRNENKKVCDISEDVMRALLEYDWPGNIRELENIIERAVILCKGSTIGIVDLPDFLQDIKGDRPVPSLSANGKVPLKEALKFSEKNIIERVLDECGGNRTRAAELLGINRTTLYNKMKEYGMLQDE